MIILVTQPFKISNNSSAIQSENCADNQCTVAHSNNDDGIDNTFGGGSNSFTAEQELFKKRYEEGYDLLNDADYVRWIKTLPGQKHSYRSWIDL